MTAELDHVGKGDAVVPGQGRLVEGPFTPKERSAMARGHATLPLTGQTTLDICLNDHTFWRNVPLPVWRYKLGGLPGAQEMPPLSGAGGVVAGAAS